MTPFSYYKEDIEGEKGNYCQMTCQVTGQTPINVLKDVSREAVAVAKRAEQILHDSPTALKVFNEYKNGFT